jgi:hypothetical protein
MATQDQVLQMVADFERDHPEPLSDRLKWWTHVLGIDRVRLFRLLGLSGREAANTPLRALAKVVASHEDRAEMVDEMLGHLLASFDYDFTAFRSALHGPVAAAPKEKRRITRRADLVVPLPYVPRPQSRSGILLNQIVAGGPFALPALMAYLREARAGEHS